MDIRDWPLDQVMQLPDCCFGRRFRVFAEKLINDVGPDWDISEMGLPNRCILWDVSLEMWNEDVSVHNVRIALGDQLPASGVMMSALEPLLPGFGNTGAEPRMIIVRPGYAFALLPMRQFLAAQGRRLVVEVSSVFGKYVWVRVSVQVSTIPTEVPDWLLSGHLRSR